MKYRLLLVLISVPILVFAHGKEDHSDEPKKTMTTEDRPQRMMQTHSNINREYQRYVKPIFKTKCFDCHGMVDEYPWYYKVPGIKQIMDYDIREAKEHLDMTNDFPFGGHGEPLNDLKSIRKAIEEGTMPPLRYRVANWDSRLNKEEKKVLEKWIDAAERMIKNR